MIHFIVYKIINPIKLKMYEFLIQILINSYYIKYIFVNLCIYNIIFIYSKLRLINSLK